MKNHYTFLHLLQSTLVRHSFVAIFLCALIFGSMPLPAHAQINDGNFNINFDAGNVYDPFDAGNVYDPANPIYDTDYDPTSANQPVAQAIPVCEEKIKNLGSLINLTICYLQRIIVPMLVTLAIIMFIWGVIHYVIASDVEEKAKGRTFMIWGIVALFSIVAMWGLVRVLANTFGVEIFGIPHLKE